nr:MAG TPA: hypothetical protein [Caudoviricetes sp.]
MASTCISTCFSLSILFSFFSASSMSLLNRLLTNSKITLNFSCSSPNVTHLFSQ